MTPRHEQLVAYNAADKAQDSELRDALAPWMRYADIHSVHCHAHRVPHDHGIACHSTCPTCGGKADATQA